ncbi:hypothetical protein J1N09_13995 [Aureitalea sp. L0-47]|uniref:hypothetical protein n=1 Tax=Aureitalea sp. L0-47 TaxID=2816962 RepID=UPI0022380429|nr:hypothetical protein [Aureitalea sp. L0-47]MCW5520957.1 hypothetical protein [Aureitalea sp. L0-47]
MRKELIIILSLFWLMACNSGMETDAMKSTEAMEAEETVSAAEMDIDEAMPVVSELNYQGIVSEKLQEYAELQELINTHPEFETDLREQLLSLSQESILDIGNSEIVQISEIQVLESTEGISDSLESRIKFSFKLTTDTQTRSDSLLAKIQKKTVVIDGETLVSTKVTFESLQDY